MIYSFYAKLLFKWRGKSHWSDCSLHNGPALLPDPCDCGGFPKKRKPIQKIGDAFLLRHYRRLFHAGLL